MKKGDRRRQDIMETAERLFYQKGYEQTSIQDILDELKLSKGGFYHHFESKMQLLEAICDQRGVVMRENIDRALDECPGGAVDKLNALFSRSGLWQTGSLDFSLLLLRVAYQEQQAGYVLRERLKRVTINSAREPLEAIIHEGMAEKVFFSRYPDGIGELLLLIFANLVDVIAEIMSEDLEAGAFAPRALAALEVNRGAMELLLNAPHGSVVILELERVMQLYSALTGRS